jgi:DNA-binding PadR family transcriptional regulator
MELSNIKDRHEPGNAETALLGLLAEAPKHPYQIEKDVQFRDMRAWTDLSMSSIYKVLRKLEKRRLVEGKPGRSKHNRRRKIYHLTGMGRMALREAVRTGLATHVVAKNPFDVAIYNRDLLSAAETRASLKRYRKGLEEAIHGYKALREFLRKEGCSEARQALALRAVAMLEGEQRWLRSYCKELGHG